MSATVWTALKAALAAVVALAALLTGTVPAGAVPGGPVSGGPLPGGPLPGGTAATSPAAGRQAQDGQRPGVLIVSYPRLTWRMVREARPPALLDLLERSALANLSVRTIGADTSLGEGYASIGAGNRAGAPDDLAGSAFDPAEQVGEHLAGVVYQRRTGRHPSGALVHLGIAAVHQLNRRLRYGARPGALGGVLAEAGATAAAIGNADVRAAEPNRRRQLALAVMDPTGRVPGGTVAVDLLADAPLAASGALLDVGNTVGAFTEAWREHDVVLLEMSDLERADAAGPLVSPERAASLEREAVARADEILAGVVAHVDPTRDLVLVVAPAAPTGPDQLTVAAIAGPGVDAGWAVSATTRRDRYVTLPDVAPTVLEFLGLERPPEMTGTPIRPAGSEPAGSGPAGNRDAVGERIHTLVTDNESATFRDRAVAPVTVTFIVAQLLAYGLAVVALARRNRTLQRVLRPALLAVLAVPPVVYLAGLVPQHALGLWVVVPGVFVVAGGAGLITWLLGRGHLLLPPLVLVTVTLVVLVGDVVTGGTLQLDTVFGYSPIVAGRFAGFGNQAFGLLAASAIFAVTGWWGVWRRRRATRPARDRWAVAVAAAVFAMVVIADGHPSLGSDVGGVLATVPAFTLVLVLLAGGRVGWRRIAAIGALTAVAIGAFAAVDLARDPGARTHLGRLVADVGRAGGGGIGTVLQRKAATNLDILTRSVWSVLVPVALAFFAYLMWRPSRTLHRLHEQVPGLRAGLVGALVAGVLGFALNDSGVAVPAIMLAVVLPYVGWLALAVGEPGPVAGDPQAAVGQPRPVEPEAADSAERLATGGG